MSRTSSPLILAGLTISMVVVGCAAPHKQAPASAPEAPPSPPAEPAMPSSTTAAPSAEEARDLETLEADLAREEQILRSLMLSQDAAAGEAPEDSEGQPAAPPKSPAVGGATKAETLSDRTTRCDRACRALESMRRSADGICRLADGDEPCDRANERVSAAQDMIHSAGCSC